MRLELATFQVRDIAFGPRTQLENGHLTINREELRRLLQEDASLGSVEIELARPGESVRIVHLFDTVEPRLKVAGPGGTFPGLLGPPLTVGAGRSHRLAGLAVMESSLLPIPPTGLLTPREAIVDLSGPGAAYSPFSQTLNVVLVLRAAPGVSNEEHEVGIRRAGLRAAVYLAETTRGLEPDAVETFELGPAPGLPKVVYIDQVQSQALYAQTIVYGKHVNDILPTILHPNEMLDTAVVGANFVYGCVKNPTYFHQNNPVVRGLYRRHGRELDFRGVVLARGHNYNYAWKERSGQYAAKLAKLLDAEGAILTQEGSGNANIDLMLTIRGCEQLGIKTTFITYELGGTSGFDAPLIMTVPEADAIVSAGGQDRTVTLPLVERVIGGDEVRDYGPALGPLDICLEQVYCSTSSSGAGTMACEAY